MLEVGTIDQTVDGVFTAAADARLVSPMGSDR
jgi:hypothetical protein